MPGSRPFFSRFGTPLLLAVVGAVFLFFFCDRIACLFPKAGAPFKSAISGADNSYYYFWLRGAMVRHDADVARDIAECATMPDDLRHNILGWERTPTGLLPNKYGIGWAIGSVPWYLLGSGATRLLGLPRDGFGPAYQTALFFGQLVYALASLFLAWRIALRFVSPLYALPGVFLTWLGSFLVYYQGSATTMAHNTVFFALTVTFWAALKIEEIVAEKGHPSPWLWLLLGAGAGLAVVSRYQAVVLLLHPALVMARQVQKAWRGVALACVPFAFCVGLQMAAWKVVFGTWLMPSYGGESFQWGDPHLRDVLFSPYHGLYYWNPALLLGTAGLVWLAWQQASFVPRCWLLSLLAMWVVNGAWSCWFFGASFGLRAFEGAVLPMMVGLGYLLDRLDAFTPFRQMNRPSARATVVLVVALVLAFLNVNLVYLARKDVLSSERPVTHSEMRQLLFDYWSSWAGGVSKPKQNP